MKSSLRVSRKFQSNALAATVAVVSFSLFSQSAHAQLEEMVVFAQKVEENLQQVPVAVTAFNGEEFDAAGLSEFSDIQRLTPNFFVADRGTLGGAFSGMTIRGQSSAFFTLNADQAVGIYIDGAPVTRGTAISSNMFDVERVEVLKGPQGTLYGKNTTGGAINIFTNAPVLGEFSGFGEITAGNFNQLDVKGALNIPLSETAAFRLSAANTTRDGYGEGFYTGQDLADDNETILRGSLLLEPTESVSIRLNAGYHEVDEMNSIFRYLTGGDVLSDVDFHTGNDIDQDNENTSETTNFGLNITADLGGVQLDSITSYREQEAASNQQIISFTPTYLAQDSEFFSQELRFSGYSMSEKLFWQAGLFYSNESGEDYDFLPGLFFIIPPQVTSADNETFAIFGQATYEFNERLSGHLGLRHTDEDRKIDLLEVTQLSSGDSLGTSLTVDGIDLHVGGSVVGASESFDDISWSTGLDYKFSENIFGYATIAKGFKSGALDQDVIGVVVDPETVLNYELGLKADMADDTVRVNVAVFRTEYDDIQRTVSVPAGPSITTALASAEEAVIAGVEIELIVAPTEHISFGGSLGRLNAEYSKFFDIDPATLGPRDRSDDSFGVPEKQASAFVRYDGQLSEGMNFGFGINYFYQGEADLSNVGTSSFAGEFTRVDSYSLVNLAADFALTEGTELSIYANNIFDEEHFTTGFAIAPFSAQQPGDPRTYGVSLRTEF